MFLFTYEEQGGRLSNMMNTLECNEEGVSKRTALQNITEIAFR